jgi:hypothetical protein
MTSNPEFRKSQILMYVTHLIFILMILSIFACTNKEEAARKMYNEALNLEQSEQDEKAFEIYKEIVGKYPETQTAVDVNKRLLVIKKTLNFSIRELIVTALKLFKMDNARYPTTEEGLSVLLENKSNLPYWKGPYIEDKSSKYISLFTYTNEGFDYTLTFKE